MRPIAPALVAVLLSGCLEGPLDEEGASAPVSGGVLASPGFDGGWFDTGLLEEQCVIGAPWGEGSWGIEATAFKLNKTNRIDGARFASLTGDLYLFGHEARGAFSVTRAIQGAVWPGADTSCGRRPWRVFEPVPARAADKLEIDLYRDTTRLLTPVTVTEPEVGTYTVIEPNSWAMFAFNVWLSSPSLPPGPDIQGHKPIVMDLALFHVKNDPNSWGIRSREDADAYRYQVHLADAPLGQWEHFEVPLQDRIQDALRTFGLPASLEDDLRIYQVEFVIELKNAEGAATIDDFQLRLQR